MLGMLEWWREQPWWLRYGASVVLLLITGVLFLNGIIWPWGAIMGVVLFFFSGKSNSEKNGYRF